MKIFKSDKIVEILNTRADKISRNVCTEPALIDIDKKLTIWYAISAESRGSPPDKAECG